MTGEVKRRMPNRDDFFLVCGAAAILTTPAMVVIPGDFSAMTRAFLALVRFAYVFTVFATGSHVLCTMCVGGGVTEGTK